MRVEGVRRENVLRNTGKIYYAFNALQRAMLPITLRPVDIACGDVVS